MSYQKWFQFICNYVFLSFSLVFVIIIIKQLSFSPTQSFLFNQLDSLRPDIFINSQKVYGQIIIVMLRNLLKKTESSAGTHLSASCKRHQAGRKEFPCNIILTIQQRHLQNSITQATSLSSHSLFTLIGACPLPEDPLDQMPEKPAGIWKMRFGYQDYTFLTMSSQ